MSVDVNGIAEAHRRARQELAAVVVANATGSTSRERGTVILDLKTANEAGSKVADALTLAVFKNADRNPPEECAAIRRALSGYPVVQAMRQTTPR